MIKEIKDIISKKYSELILEDKDGKVIFQITPDAIYMDDEDAQLTIYEREEEVIKCVDCGEEFIFTDNEKTWYEEKGFSKPKRCAECREFRKQQNQ